MYLNRITCAQIISVLLQLHVQCIVCKGAFKFEFKDREGSLYTVCVGKD